MLSSPPLSGLGLEEGDKSLVVYGQAATASYAQAAQVKHCPSNFPTDQGGGPPVMQAESGYSPVALYGWCAPSPICH